MEDIQTFFGQHYELCILVFGIFFIVAAWCDWDLIFDPPYNSIKNPVGFFLGRKAYRITWFLAGILIIVIVLFLFYTQYTKSITVG